MNNETENSMVLGSEYEESTERPEPEFERDTSLVDALVDITLSQQIDRLDDLCERLENTTYGKRQA